MTAWAEMGLAPLVCRHTLKGPDVLFSKPSPCTPAWLLLDEMDGQLDSCDDLAAAADGALKILAVDRSDALRTAALWSGLPGRVMLTHNSDGTGLLELWRPDVTNATPEARLAADYVCGTCDEDGVAEVLEFLVLSVRAAV